MIGHEANVVVVDRGRVERLTRDGGGTGAEERIALIVSVGAEAFDLDAGGIDEGASDGINVQVVEGGLLLGAEVDFATELAAEGAGGREALITCDFGGDAKVKCGTRGEGNASCAGGFDPNGTALACAVKVLTSDG